MTDTIELRFEFPNGTVVRAFDYACGYDYEKNFQYRKNTAANSIHLTDYKVSGYLIVSIRDYVTIKKAIQAKKENQSNLNAVFSYTSDDFQLIQNIKEFKIYSQKIGRKVSQDSPDESVILNFVAKDLTEEV